MSRKTVCDSVRKLQKNVCKIPNASGIFQMAKP